jgi:hypothetical protein
MSAIYHEKELRNITNLLVVGVSLVLRRSEGLSLMLLGVNPDAESHAVMDECTKLGGTKGDRALLGILCTRNSAQLYLIKQAYYTMFNETLENHIDGCDTSIAADFQNKVCCGSHWLLEIPSPETVCHHFWPALIHPN